MGIILGKDVRAIRLALGLPVSQFAAVLGVHASSIHRWEAAADSPATIEGVARTVLLALRHRVLADKHGRKLAEQTGTEISEKLAVGGVLVALALLIAFAAKQE